jgi:hypothetical protein
MRYLRWDDRDAEGLSAVDGIVSLYTEVDGEGRVRREVGVNHDGKVVHRFPSTQHPHGTYGLFDLQGSRWMSAKTIRLPSSSRRSVGCRKEATGTPDRPPLNHG